MKKIWFLGVLLGAAAFTLACGGDADDSASATGVENSTAYHHPSLAGERVPAATGSSVSDTQNDAQNRGDEADRKAALEQEWKPLMPHPKFAD